MQNKKGISDVVSTVLIILLVVAAVAIVGAIVLNLIKNSGTSVTNSVACQSLDIQPTSCTKTTTGATVVVTRGSGGSDVQVSTITVYAQKSTGESLVSANVTSVPASIGTGTATIAYATPTDINNVKVAAMISGTTGYCPASSTITCS